MFARLRFSQNQLNSLVEKKMGKKQTVSTKNRPQIVTLSNLKFSLREIAKMKVSKTAVHNAIMKYRNESVFIHRKRSVQSRVITSRKECLMRKAVTHPPMSTSEKSRLS